MNDLNLTKPSKTIAQECSAGQRNAGQNSVTQARKLDWLLARDIARGLENVIDRAEESSCTKPACDPAAVVGRITYKSKLAGLLSRLAKVNGAKDADTSKRHGVDWAKL